MNNQDNYSVEDTNADAMTSKLYLIQAKLHNLKK